MKIIQPTYIDLRPKIEEPEPQKRYFGMTVTRDAHVVVKYEVRKYTVFTLKTALKGLKIAHSAIAYAADDLATNYERQHARKRVH